jgi:hypothetical protein
MSRRAAKVDAVQPMWVAALRKLGYKVDTGHNDILVTDGNGNLLLLEIKSPGAKKRVQPSQIKLQKEFGSVYMITDDLQEVIDWFKERQ